MTAKAMTIADKAESKPRRNPNRVRQWHGGRVHHCDECAYCVPLPRPDDAWCECRRLTPQPSNDGTGYVVPIVPKGSFFCGLFLPRAEVLQHRSGGDANTVRA